MKPPLSRDNVNRSQGEDVPRHRLQDQSIPFNKFGYPKKQELSDKQETAETPPYERLYHQQRGDKSGYPKEIIWEKRVVLRRNDEKFSLKSSDPPSKNVVDIEQPKDPQERIITFKILSR